jgi:IMP dehydrogenase
MYDLSDVKRVMGGAKTKFNLDANGRLRVAAAIGIYDDAFARIEQFPSDIDAVVIDTAHGHTRGVADTVKALKKKYGEQFDIVVGNVSEPDAVEFLIKIGADGIKVGQGPGSICTTRVVTGVGCPQLTAIHNCARAARNSGVPICGDGGIVVPGDIPKALVAGADSVMLGGLLAGCEESPSEAFVDQKGRRMKKYRGMGSLGAMQSRGGRERYGQGDVPQGKLVPEGVEGAVPYTGVLSNTLHELLGGLRAGMGYLGTRTISEMQHRGDFHQITQAALEEGRPHNIVMMVESPNYRR